MATSTVEARNQQERHKLWAARESPSASETQVETDYGWQMVSLHYFPIIGWFRRCCGSFVAMRSFWGPEIYMNVVLTTTSAHPYFAIKSDSLDYQRNRPQYSRDIFRSSHVIERQVLLYRI